MSKDLDDWGHERLASFARAMQSQRDEAMRIADEARRQLERSRIPGVGYIEFCHDVSQSTLKEFANNLIEVSDIDGVGRVYDRECDEWVDFKLGDYIVRGKRGNFFPFRPVLDEPSEDEGVNEPDADPLDSDSARLLEKYNEVFRRLKSGDDLAPPTTGRWVRPDDIRSEEL